MPALKPTTESVLKALTKERIQSLGREFRVALNDSMTKSKQISNFTRHGDVDFEEILNWLNRDELKAACKSHNLEDSGRARALLATRLLKAHGKEVKKQIKVRRLKLEPGTIVRVRQRQYLVEKVIQPKDYKQMTKVDLVCLDDDNQGKSLSVLWELELGARILAPERAGLGKINKFDKPSLFAAYLNALKWNSVTATDPNLFQSPFRAGIAILNHQLIPLQKALNLPRANLFIADDVGLGKTIEAGLILQELILRQRVDFMLIVCPAAISLQWRDEMRKKFGLHFELYNRHFVGRKRKERGFSVNPWSTHNRFIISYQTLRRPEYRDPLLQHIGDRVKRSLLILDEAHTAAPSTSSKYAIDSKITRVIRDVAPRFENRLFLSATPHNGHSNSFSALLEILDPQRFTRGVKVHDAKQLNTVMVRRLKEDLRKLGTAYPERKVIEIALTMQDGAWQAQYGAGSTISLGSSNPAELELSEMLAEYRTLMEPEKGRGKLVFIGLQKRLLSGIEAFARTLGKHVISLEKKQTFEVEVSLFSEADEYGEEAEIDAEIDAQVSQGSTVLSQPKQRAKVLLEKMQEVAAKRRSAADAKVLALVDWIRTNQCPAAKVGGADLSAERNWSDKRVLIFTEFADTKRLLYQIFSTAIEGTDKAEERIMQFHGGMSDDQREEVQQSFNGPPNEYPVRILLATDAAREGINLQGHCSDLFHFDIPWNPARMEQRNGRIDRTMQPEPEVRCYYFTYPDRKEDIVLKKIIKKVAVIQKELGSLGTVIMEQMTDILGDGITDKTAGLIEKADIKASNKAAVIDELESQRELDKLKKEIDKAGSLLDKSRSFIDMEPAVLKTTIEAGLALTGAKPLVTHKNEAGLDAFRLPELPDSWNETLDWLRPPRKRDEPFWEWRKREPLPVVFDALEKFTSSFIQLHLEHPLVQRVLSRFRSQGYSAHDLQRATVLINPKDFNAKVIIFGRFSLFGKGATRLHDELIAISAPWLESKGKGHLVPESSEKTLLTLGELLKSAHKLEVSDAIQNRLTQSAEDDFVELWQHVEAEAEAHLHDAEQKLKARGNKEATELTKIIENQRKQIQKATQLTLDFATAEKADKKQYEDDQKYLKMRLGDIAKELAEEPAQIKQLYEVILKRLEPVGMIYLWPKSKA